jgi:hypothetical protein
MKTKQATHVQPVDTDEIRVVVCEWGGYMALGGCRDGFYPSKVAAFANADECADWLRGFLKNAAARKFGAKPQS